MSKLDEKGHYHESYFEHPCVVVGSEKDVLKTDIRGRGWAAALRRWWYGLFLLSYGDERCRVYYSSSHALRLERARHFRRYRGRIHPLSRFSNMWAVLMLVVTIANRVVFNHNTSVMYGRLQPATHVAGVACEAVLLLDLIVHLKTGYLDTEARKVVLSSRKCLVHYCSTKLFFHVVAAIPLQAIMLVRYKLQRCSLCTANKFVCCLKFLSTFTLFRVFEASLYWTREQSSFTLTVFFKLLRVLVLAVICLLQFLNFTDAVNIWIITETNHIVPYSFLEKIMEVKKYLSEDAWDNFFTSVQFSIICKSLFLFGYGSYGGTAPIYYVDAIQSLAGFIIANLFRIWAFVEWYTVISRQKTVKEHMDDHKDMTMNFMRSRQVSDQFSSKVSDYYDFFIARMMAIEKLNDVYQLLPTCILKEIKICSYYRYVRRIPYFSDWPVDIVEDLVMLLKEEVYLKEDIVAPRWSPGEGLMILHVGMLAVYTASQQEVGHLIDGDYFGELSLVTDREVRTSEVVAITPCQILILYKKSFRRFMRQHDKLFFELRDILRNKFHSYPERPSGQTNPQVFNLKSPDPKVKKAPKTVEMKQTSSRQEPDGRTSTERSSRLQRHSKDNTQQVPSNMDNDVADYEWGTVPRGLSHLHGSTGIRRPSTQMAWSTQLIPSGQAEATASTRQDAEPNSRDARVSQVLKELLDRREVSKSYDDALRYNHTQHETANTYGEPDLKKNESSARVSQVLKDILERREVSKTYEDATVYAPTEPRRYSPTQRTSGEDNTRSVPQQLRYASPDPDNSRHLSRRVSLDLSRQINVPDDSRINIPEISRGSQAGGGASRTSLSPRIRRQMRISNSLKNSKKKRTQ